MSKGKATKLSKYDARDLAAAAQVGGTHYGNLRGAGERLVKLGLIEPKGPFMHATEAGRDALKKVKLGSQMKKNPLRHFPKLKGRGRPKKTKTWEMTTVLSNGAVAVRSGMKATKEEAYARAARILKRTFKGKKVREVMLDDGR